MLVKEERMNVGGLERPLRLAAGAWLFASLPGGPRWSARRLIQELTAVELLASALTGYCLVNDLIGRDSRHASGRGGGILQR